MFTEFEIETMIENKRIFQAVDDLRKDFLKTDAPYLEISEHDFLSLVMMAPTVGIALANGSVSLFEELALNKKARKLSKGGYFMKRDPVVHGLKFLIKKYDSWETKFFGLIKLTMEELCDMEALHQKFDASAQVSYAEYKREVLKTPYIFIRYLSSFFTEDDEDIISIRSMVKVDYERMKEIGGKLGLNGIPVFHMFCQTFKVK
ncbi:MAG: hypothetical protein AAFO69_01530 [Bacteroidota bacterium]